MLVSANPPINDHSVDQKPQIELSGRHSNLIHLTVRRNRPVASVLSLSCKHFIHAEGLGVSPLCELVERVFLCWILKMLFYIFYRMASNL